MVTDYIRNQGRAQQEWLISAPWYLWPLMGRHNSWGQESSEGLSTSTAYALSGMTWITGMPTSMVYIQPLHVACLPYSPAASLLMDFFPGRLKTQVWTILGDKAEAASPFTMKPRKSHSVISTVFFWLKRSQVHPESREGKLDQCFIEVAYRIREIIVTTLGINN